MINRFWKKFGKEIRFWLLLLLVLGLLRFTGYQAEVIGSVQRLLLWTGIMNAPAQPTRSQFEAIEENWYVENIQGELLQLNDYAGHVVIINFWASWCPPCMAELPSLHALQQRIEQNPELAVQLWLVNMDDAQNHEKVQRLAVRKGVSDIVYFPKSRWPASLDADVLPTTFVLAPGKRLVYQKKGMANYSTDAFWEWIVSLTQN